MFYNIKLHHPERSAGSRKVLATVIAYTWPEITWSEILRDAQHDNVGNNDEN